MCEPIKITTILNWVKLNFEKGLKKSNPKWKSKNNWCEQKLLFSKEIVCSSMFLLFIIFGYFIKRKNNFLF